MVRDVTALQAVTRNRVSRTQQEKSGTFLMRGGPGGEKKKKENIIFQGLRRHFRCGSLKVFEFVSF